MRAVRGVLALGWIVIIVSLFWDPITPALTDPANAESPFRINPDEPVLVQGEPLEEEPYALGARLFWTMLIPLVPLFLMLFGHEAWRRVCPLSFITQIPRYLDKQFYRKRFNRRSGRVERKLNLVPRGGWLQRNHWYLQFGLLFAALCVRILFVNSDRIALAGFMIGIIAIALTVSLIWGGKTWCNYFCPIGVVQKIYTEPGGLLESKAHREKRPVTQSMCRTSTEAGDRSICVGCTADCPDIDLEGGYWKGIEQPGRRFAYYGFFGLVVGFYTYYYLYSGSWDYYFSGAWTHEAGQLGALFAPGLFLSGQPVPYLPKLVATPLVLALFVLASFLLGAGLERLYARVRIAMGRPLNRRDLLNHTFSVTAFLSINAFYIFGGRPNLALLPSWGLWLADALILFISAAWLLRSIARSHNGYQRESMMSSLLKQLKRLNVDFDKILEGRSLDDLKPDEVYVLAKTLPGFTREQRLQLYANVLREALRTGQVNSANSLALMREVRLEMGISDEEHRQVLTGLGIEDMTLLDPERVQTQEAWLRRDNYREELEELVQEAVARRQEVRAYLQRPETRRRIERLRARYSIEEAEHGAVLGELLGDTRLLLGRAAELVDRLVEASAVLYRIEHPPEAASRGLLAALGGVLERRRLQLAEHLIGLLISLGDGPEARRLAANAGVLMGARLEPLLDARRLDERLAAGVREALRSGAAEEPLSASAESLLRRVSFVEVVRRAPDLGALFRELITDEDPLVTALALAGLAAEDLDEARRQARALDAAGPADRHWLLREQIDLLLGRKVDASPSAAEIRFTRTHPDGRSERLAFTKPLVTIGKALENDVVVFEPAVAPYHAVVRQTADGLSLGILDAAHGIYRNGERRADDGIDLADGDELRFAASERGGARLRVEWRREDGAGYQREHRDTVTRIAWLRELPIFSELDLDALADLARSIQVRVYSRGAALCEQGQPSQGAFVIRRGGAEVYADGQRVNRMGEGRVIGEISIITGQPYLATVRVDAERATVLVIDRERFRALLDENHGASKAILGQVAGYLQRPDQPTEQEQAA